jgi:hypothetical protein
MNRREFLKVALATAVVGPKLLHPIQAVGRRVTYLILDDPIQDRPQTAMEDLAVYWDIKMNLICPRKRRSGVFIL